MATILYSGDYNAHHDNIYDLGDRNGCRSALLVRRRALRWIRIDHEAKQLFGTLMKTRAAVSPVEPSAMFVTSALETKM